VRADEDAGQLRIDDTPVNQSGNGRRIIVGQRIRAGSKMRDLIGLACDGCKRRNYTTSKNKKRQTEKFAIKKFCPSCREHTTHKETKV
jgi:large subunit ribosomal protein L33